MHFSKLIAPVVALLATTAAASPIEKRAVTATQLVDELTELAKQAKDLQTTAKGIKATNGLIPFGPSSNGAPNFNDLINGFQGIISTGTGYISVMEGSAPITDTAAEQKVCDAFSNFVVVNNNLLNIVIGKAGLLQGIFLGPVAAVLRALENVYDTLAFGIIDSVPYCADKATSEKSKLDATLGKAICAYTPAGTLGLNLFC